MLNLKTARTLGLSALLLTTAAVPMACAQEAPAAQDPPSATAEQAEENREAVQGSVDEEAGRQLDERRQQLISEAVSAIDETENALTALDEGETRQALDALAVATGKLELIVAREPELQLAPVAVNMITHDVLADVPTIEAARERIEDLIDDGEIQKARPLISAFGSELVISTSNLPLGTYPDAIKLATKLIDQGDVEGAKQVLRTALGTLVVTDAVVPLPIMRAEMLLAEAEAKLDRTATETSNDAATDDTAEGSSETVDAITPEELVEAAREELRIAEALGYGVERDYADLRDSIEELDDQIEAEEDTGGIFDTIADNFRSLRTRIFGE
ncbi:YfdX family protein [Notoacmeibacter marinus]|uniref:YfdX family protein n=1 Tax=Notoacmeibacter marinus TaxID=1876515 RepID=UPI000DF35709|nr:YfdX family protein [Notoacmeibacter marinus]